MYHNVVVLSHNLKIIFALQSNYIGNTSFIFATDVMKIVFKNEMKYFRQNVLMYSS